jgi:IclR family pca regulon transcriptional regulator
LRTAILVCFAGYDAHWEPSPKIRLGRGSGRLASFTEETLTDPCALRAEVARIRRQGWAELVDELEEGLAAISVPVRSPAGVVVAVVGIGGPTFGPGRNRRRDLPVVQAAAAEIEREVLRQQLFVALNDHS